MEKRAKQKNKEIPTQRPYKKNKKKNERNPYLTLPKKKKTRKNTFLEPPRGQEH